MTHSILLSTYGSDNYFLLYSDQIKQKEQKKNKENT